MEFIKYEAINLKYTVYRRLTYTAIDTPNIAKQFAKTCHDDPMVFCRGKIPLKDAKEILQKINSNSKNPKEKPFPDENIALLHLHLSLQYFDDLASKLIHEEINTPKHQRDYYDKLTKAATKLLEVLEKSNEITDAALYQTNLALSKLTKVKTPADTPNLFGELKHPALSINEYKIQTNCLITASKHLRKKLIGQGVKASTDRSDLRYLIQLLQEVYFLCNGKEGKYTQDAYNKGQYGGDFFKFVWEIQSYFDLKSEKTLSNIALGKAIKSIISEQDKGFIANE